MVGSIGSVRLKIPSNFNREIGRDNLDNEGSSKYSGQPNLLFLLFIFGIGGFVV